MIYRTAADWRASERKRVLLFGMSGLGKTHIAKMLRAGGQWYHYSVDYRIGTKYMGEHIVDNFKRVAMDVPLLKELLMSDSIYIGSNITFDNLAPLATYLGKPGDPTRGGLAFADYMRRQDQHRQAEIAALMDTGYFRQRAWDIYRYPHFVCDSGGSICEVVDPDDPEDPILTALSREVLLVWIEGSAAHTEELIRRFDQAPKPMYYRPDFLHEAWQGYLDETGSSPADADPDGFLRWAFARALAHREPLYAAMARNWGVTVPADAMALVSDPAGFEDAIAAALPER